MLPPVVRASPRFDVSHATNLLSAACLLDPNSSRCRRLRPCLDRSMFCIELRRRDFACRSGAVDCDQICIRVIREAVKCIVRATLRVHSKNDECGQNPHKNWVGEMVEWLKALACSSGRPRTTRMVARPDFCRLNPSVAPGFHPQLRRCEPPPRGGYRHRRDYPFRRHKIPLHWCRMLRVKNKRKSLVFARGRYDESGYDAKVYQITNTGVALLAWNGVNNPLPPHAWPLAEVRGRCQTAVKCLAAQYEAYNAGSPRRRPLGPLQRRLTQLQFAALGNDFKLLAQALAVFDSAPAAAEWLTQPAAELHGAIPARLVTRSTGWWRVFNALVRREGKKIRTGPFRSVALGKP